MNEQLGFLATNGRTVQERQRQHFISSVLQLPALSVAYEASARLTELYADRAVLCTDSSAFNLDEFVSGGQCIVRACSGPHAEVRANWDREKKVLERQYVNAWLTVDWQGQELEVLRLQVGDDTLFYLIAASRAMAESFYAAVCRWQNVVREEVMVFEQGYWQKNDRLFRSIKDARIENLVLPGALRDQIVDDVRRFFAARDIYMRYGVAWKRGILFTGPPGNGKTHMVKALVNLSGQACLYVKSFRRHGAPDEYGMRQVFEQARLTTPCILVLEDLDALITDKNRSYFLNEMDGFASNGGILTLATTNHPEHLDAAIVERPSRFDRTYRFDLPGVLEREMFIARWNSSLEPAMHLTISAVAHIAEQTDGFSFAYLKELFLAATMRWLEESRSGAMEETVCEQVAQLRSQMRAVAEVTGKSRR